MALLPRITSLLRNLLRREQAEADLDAEVGAAVELLVGEKVRAGMSPEEARRAARLELGGVEQVKEEVRAVRAGAFFETTVRDLRYGARALRRRPAFAAAGILTLALGVGANTAIFSVVRAVLLAPLPFDDPDRLMLLSEEAPGGGRMSVAVPNFQDWRGRARSFERMAAFRSAFFTLTGGETPLRLSGRMVTWDFLAMLGVQPILGRPFTPDDDRPEAAPMALIGEGLWRRRFGAAPSVIGGTMSVDGTAFTIIGVLPGDFEFFRRDEILVPVGLVLTPQSDFLDRGNHFGLYALGRLRRGVSLQAARAEMEALAEALEREYPATNSGNGALVRPLADVVVQDIRPTLLVLMSGVGFVLMIACANVANLSLARAAARGREIAVRAALGASRSRILRMLLTESLLVFLLGGLAGLGLGQWALDALLALVPPGLPRLGQVRMDGVVLAFTLGVSLLTGLVFGWLPARQAARADLQAGLREAGRSQVGAARQRTRRALLVAQMGLALMLLVGAGLMVRTVVALVQVDPGFRPANLLAASFSLPPGRYPEQKQREFYRDALARIEALPGVASATLGLSLPVQGSNWNSIFIVSNQPVPERANLPSAAFNPVSTRYFETLGIRLLRGRPFTEADGPGAATVAVINETLAKRLWPDEDPIGKRLKQGWPEDDHPWREVVGVVADVSLEGIDRDVPMQAYLPLPQAPTSGLSLVVRAAGEPTALAPSVEKAVHEIDPDLPVFGILTMEQILGDSIGRQRLAMVLLGIFAGLAVALAAVGVYGVISYGVTQQTHELAVRMALGAGRGDIFRMVVWQGMRLALIGMAFGLAGVLGLTRFLESLLFGVEPADPLTLSGVSALLVFVAFLACALPARRAVRIDPAILLRSE